MSILIKYHRRTVWGLVVLALLLLVLAALSCGPAPVATPTQMPPATNTPVPPATPTEAVVVAVTKEPTATRPAPPSPTKAPPAATSTPRPTATPAPVAALFPFGISDVPLEVVITQPADGAEDVAISRDETRIVVQFNHPVVPLVTVDAMADLPHPLEFEPPLRGQGEWINTSMYAFTPSQDLEASTRYTVRLRAGLKDVMDAELSDDYVWTFATQFPLVVSTYPDDGTLYAGVSQPITITFNQPMDRASVESRFSLEASDGARATGRFRWVGNEVAFLPDPPLAYERRYTALLAAGAMGANGAGSLEREYRWRFMTTAYPKIISTSPRGGETKSRAIREGFVISFNAPMDPEGLSYTIVPTITYPGVGFWESETQARIWGGWQASTEYTVTIKAESRGRYGETLGEDAVVRFTAAPLDPTMWLNTPGQVGMYDAHATPVIWATYTNVDAINYSIHRVSRDDYLKLTGEDQWRYWDDYRPDVANLVREWTQPVTAMLDASLRVSTTLTLDGGAPIGPGVYFLKATAPGVEWPSKHLLVVSNVNLTLKRTETEALVWATDLATGKPVPDLPIAMFRFDGRVLASGRTNADGVYRATFSRLDPWRSLSVVSETAGDITAAVGGDWRDGIYGWDFNIPEQPSSQDFYANLYTDRAIYRPGQTVYFRGILRRDDDASYSLPLAVEQVPVSIFDSQGKEVLKTELPLSPFGTFHGELELAESASLGFYSLNVQIGEGERAFYSSVGFQLAEYRRPEFQVSVQTDRPEYIQGDTVNVDVQADYFFGGPVAGANVVWRLLKDDYFFRPPDVKGYWDFGDYDFTRERFYNQQGEVVSQGEGVTDSEGHFTFSVPADVSEYPLSQVFTLEAEVTDINNQFVANRASAVVHKGQFYIGLRPQRYVGTAGKEQAVDVITLDTQGISVTQQSLVVSFYRREWYSVRERREDGSFYWTSSFTDTLISKADITTNDNAYAVARFTPPEGGVYRIVAEGTDQAGNEIRSATYLWVSGEEYVNWRMENTDRIDLVSDKRTYLPGETAEILIPAPFEGAEALLTVERGHIKLVRRLTLVGNSETVQVPIASDYAPNVYVSVVLVKGTGPDSPRAQFKLGYVNLEVSTREKELTVAITPDRRGTYGPRETVTYDIQATDYTGRGVQAELSLALVDKAVQSLAADQAVSPLQAFYGQRGLGVMTSASLVRSMERISDQLEKAAKGGGGGLAAEEGGTVRRIFPDTAYWNPSVVTGPDGRAQVSVNLPDSLTTWNMMGKGVTVGTEVGVGGVDIISTKELLIRPVTPRFFVVGDRAHLEAVVNNNTDADITTDITLEATGLSLAGPASQAMTVPARDKAKVTWETEVLPDVVEFNSTTSGVVVLFDVRGGGYQDAVELTLPVYRFSTPETVATAGLVDGRTTEQILLPDGIDTSQGELTVELNPSLAAASRDALHYLESFEYECSEQTVSKFLPNVVTWRALQLLGIDRPDLRAGLERNVSKEIQRLYALQHYDGGWGWWLPDRSNPWLTAYALFGLHTAKEAGFAVDGDVMERATQFLLEYLNRKVDVARGYDLNQRAFVFYVLAQVGRGDLGRTVRLYEQREQLDLYARAFLALTLQQLDPGQTTRLQAISSDFTGTAILSATGAHWEEADVDYWNMNTNTRTTTVVLMALTRLEPDNPLLANAVRWLMVARKEGHWETTQETVWSVLALTDYMVATGELHGDYTAQVHLNGIKIGERRVTPDDVDEPTKLVVAVKELLLGVANELTIRRDSEAGELYYAAYLRYFLPAEEIPALNRGIIVGRQYFEVDPVTLKPTGRPVNSAQIGDVVQVKLTLIAPSDLHYLVVEDPLPAGFEAVDTSLRTASVAAQAPEFREAGQPEEPDYGYWWSRPWWTYWTHSDLRDEKVALFATYLGRGTYEYTYLMRASLAGEFKTLPTVAWEMYFPEVFGRSTGMLFAVSP